MLLQNISHSRLCLVALVSVVLSLVIISLFAFMYADNVVSQKSDNSHSLVYFTNPGYIYFARLGIDINAPMELIVPVANEVATVTPPVVVPIEKVPKIELIPKTNNGANIQKEVVPVVVEKKPNIESVLYDKAFAFSVSSQIFELTNILRINNGLPPLSSDQRLTNAATTYSDSMLKKDFFSHTNPQGCDFSCRFKKEAYSAQAWGENIATLSTSKEVSAEYVAQLFMQNWENSPGHRANMLSTDFTHQGVGVAADSGRFYATVQFAKPI